MSRFISGTTGYTILERNGKKIIIFSDIHDGVKYCQDTSQDIDDYFKEHMHHNNVLIEEAVHDENISLMDLWPNASHTQKLKKLVLENKNTITPIDIRPILIPFSWELMESNEKYGQFIYKYYVRYILEFLLRKGDKYNQFVKPIIDCLDETDKNNIEEHFHILIEYFKDNLMKYKDERMIDIYNNDIEFLSKINHFISMLMEWYTILLIFNSNKNIMLHTGLAHSQKIIEMLEKVYLFRVVELIGINKFNDLPTNTPTACIYLPQNTIKKFSK